MESLSETIFHAFDLLKWNGEDWANRPYRDRLNGLDVLLSLRCLECVSKIETALSETEKLNRFEILRESRAEGIVLKLLSAPYASGRPNSGGPALKCKFTSTASFIVAKHNDGRSVSLKLYRQKTSCGSVTIPPNHRMPSPGAVVEVRYLYAFPNGSLFQPVYQGERVDVTPYECLVGRLKFKA